MKKQLQNFKWTFEIIALIFTILIVNQSFKFHKKPVNFPYMKGTDWTFKKQNSIGTEIYSVLPPASNSKNNNLKENDILIGIDNQRVYNSNIVNKWIEESGPNQILMYQIKRKNPSSDQYEAISLLIETATLPFFTIQTSNWSWIFMGWIYAIFSFITLLLLFILYPFVQNGQSNSILIFNIALFSFFIFIVHTLHHSLLFIGTQFQTSNFEIGVSFLLVLIYNILAASLWLILDSKKPFFIFATGLIIYTLNFVWVYYYNSPGFHFENIIYNSLLIISLTSFSIFFNAWIHKQIKTVYFVLILLPVISLYIFQSLFYNSFIINDLQILFLLIYSILPLAIVSINLLKFGKISLVITQSIIYVFSFLGILLVYLIIHQSLQTFNFPFFYGGIIEIVLLMLIVVIFRWFFIRNEQFLGKYFVSHQQKKQDKINLFLNNISRYTKSDQLLKDLLQEIKTFFDTQNPVLSLSDNKNLDFLTLSEKKAIYQKFIFKGEFWSKNKELSSISFDKELEDKLLNEKWILVFPLRVSKEEFGLLALEKKYSGVYNLSDVELLQRLVVQCGLFLEILRLLENEKILMQRNLEATLSALRAQINPHFLFNTLNTISYLIHDSPDDAEKAIEHLAFIFRYTLKFSSEEFVTIENEIELVNAYLSIEKLRFGERLKTEILIENNSKSVLIPAFVIQTIVENCIKHGLQKLARQGVIKIEIKEIDNFTFCEIYDNGIGIDLNRIDKGHGLNNITTRFHKIYFDNDLVQFINTGNGTKVIVKIPKIHKE